MNTPSIVQASGNSCDAIATAVTDLAQDDGCRSSEDCAAVDLPPPLGCNRPVNRANVAKIQEDLRAYSSNCEPLLFNCFDPADSVWCKGHHCVNELKHGGLRYPSNSAHNNNGRPFR